MIDLQAKIKVRLREHVRGEGGTLTEASPSRRDVGLAVRCCLRSCRKGCVRSHQHRHDEEGDLRDDQRVLSLVGL